MRNVLKNRCHITDQLLVEVEVIIGCTSQVCLESPKIDNHTAKTQMHIIAVELNDVSLHIFENLQVDHDR